MSLTTEKLAQLAAVVDDAAMTATSIAMLTLEHPELTLEDAYAIQEASMARRLARGERLVGLKMGLTSLAKMRQMGVHHPIYGHLTSTMVLGDGGRVVASEHCHPRVEPEIAFVMARELRGPVTPADAMTHVAWVAPALEVIDSRYQDFKFTLVDVVADNASSTRYALGSALLRPEGLDLGNLGMVMELNGEVRETGSSAAILEHPARSLAELANMLAHRNQAIPAGAVVLAGGATAAIAVKPGDHVRLRVELLGTVDLTVVA